MPNWKSLPGRKKTRMCDFRVQTPIAGFPLPGNVVAPTAPAMPPPHTVPVPPSCVAPTFAFVEALREPITRNAQLGAALAQIVDSFSGERVFPVSEAEEAIAPKRTVAPQVSVVVEKPVVIDQPPVAEKIVTGELPVVAEKTAVAEKAVSIETPVAVEKQVPVEMPVAVEKQVAIETPAVVEKPVAVEAPVAGPKPVVKATSVVEEKPETVVLQAAPGVVPPAVEHVVVVSEKESAAGVGGVSSVGSDRTVSASQIVLEAAQAVADTLLVSPGLLRGEGEMRVQLKPDVLDGSVVNITVTGRRIAVAFEPTTEASSVLLTEHVHELESHLQATAVGYETVVSVVSSVVPPSETSAGAQVAVAAAGAGVFRGKGVRRT